MIQSLLPKAITAIQQGLLVVYPTDTLYALGATIGNDHAVTKVFTLKHRPFSQPLPIAVASVDAIESVASMNEVARDLAQEFLPGYLTLILPKKNHISDLITANHSSVAVRVPDDRIARSLLSSVGPLTVTSTNIHQQPPTFTIPEIQTIFEPDDIAVFLDDGKREAKPSTIVDVRPGHPQIIREGMISKAEITSVRRE